MKHSIVIVLMLVLVGCQKIDNPLTTSEPEEPIIKLPYVGEQMILIRSDTYYINVSGTDIPERDWIAVNRSTQSIKNVQFDILGINWTHKPVDTTHISHYDFGTVLSGDSVVKKTVYSEYFVILTYDTLKYL